MKPVDIIVPCYNEEESIEIFYKECTDILRNIKDYNFNYIFINDGSKDNTLKIIKNLSEKTTNVKYISFSRNFGKESAILAGLKESTGAYVILMDVDLQHPPKLILDMMPLIEEGYDSVAAKREARKGEKRYREYFSIKFYKLINKISDVNIPEGATDYRIMSRQMVDCVLALEESQRFTKGIFEWVGFETKWLGYESEERVAGTTKWSGLALLKYALEGIVGFSTAPLRIATIIGLIFSNFSFIYFVITLIKTLVIGIDMPGYASIICFITFLGGIQLIVLGILGEYLSKTYLEVKRRPNYFVKESNIYKEK
ncbi:glycosyltransferase family 2 protein [Clostridium gasigenes]|uniref:glycosyltransferase family 2 protein n=1 Tax=Clostridium gasigenes TaxID=94869 RepID=UPI001C0A9445|nr:glycosyltransferase family 2 protein [Clostridium gasigenes]MBU3103177.1 glycosyltransferase family 2 protein [Clostridium gasigenes]